MCQSKEVVGTMPPVMQLLRVGKAVEKTRFVFVLILGKLSTNSIRRNNLATLFLVNLKWKSS